MEYMRKETLAPKYISHGPQKSFNVCTIGFTTHRVLSEIYPTMRKRQSLLVTAAQTTTANMNTDRITLTTRRTLCQNSSPHRSDCSLWTTWKTSHKLLRLQSRSYYMTFLIIMLLISHDTLECLPPVPLTVCASRMSCT